MSPRAARRAANALAALAALLVVAYIAIMAADEVRDSGLKSYRESFAAEASAGSGSGGKVSRARWITVEGTAVDYPLVQETEETGIGFYLDHDPDGSWSQLGTPYVDRRCAYGSRHVLCFGHRVGSTDKVFSTLADDWQADRLAAVGTARTWDESGRCRSYEPALGIKVDMSYADIQRFSFAGVAELRAWLRSIESQGAATTGDADALISRARHVLTLSTCASPIAGRDQRTLTIFVSAE